MEIKLPSHQTEEFAVTTEVSHKRHLLGSMHVVYGSAIIILALVVTGLVCVQANLPIPYISALYAPAATPDFSMQSPYHANSTGSVQNSGIMETTATTTTSSNASAPLTAGLASGSPAPKTASSTHSSPAKK